MIREEIQKIIDEKNRILNVINQQEAIVLMRIGNEKMPGLEKKLMDEAEQEWCRDLDITKLALEFLEQHKALMLLHATKFNLLNEYLEKILFSLDPEEFKKIDFKKVENIENVEKVENFEKVEKVEKKEVKPEFLLEFEDEVKRRCMECAILLKNGNVEKAKAKTRGIFKMAYPNDPYFNEKREIILKYTRDYNLIKEEGEQNEKG